jgi:hypothetical protein
MQTRAAIAELYDAVDDLLRDIEAGLATETGRATLDVQIAAISQQAAPEAWDTTVSGSPISTTTLSCMTYCGQNACYARVEIPAPVALVG